MRILRSYKVLGIGFLVLVAASVYLTYATFSKKFVSYDEVTLQTTSIGLSLPQRADVKIRGVIVGEVLDFESNGNGAQVTLGLFPDMVDTIPADVSGSIVPKTLFGEKYVSLIPTSGDVGGPHIEAGATIARTTVSTEVEEVLNDLFPLLTTVQPAELNMTLNAVATALEGRGDQLGENLETLDAYLKRLNPEIPALIEDLRLTAEVSDTYAEILPEVGTILENTITTTGTLEGREDRLNALFTDVASFSDSARTFLDENGDELVQLADVSVQQLRVLARYSPQFPCLTEGIVNAGRFQAEAFRGFKLHIILETLPRQPRRYTAADVPRIGENRGPNCLNLPNPPWSQENPVRIQPNFDDGVDSPTGKGTMRVAPDYTSMGYTGSADDAEMLRQMLARSGASDDELGPLLAGPLVTAVR